MNTKLIYAVCCAITLSVISQGAFAATQCTKSITASLCYGIDGQIQKITGSNCATTEHFCWGDKDVTECATCPNGYTLTTQTLESDNCTNTTTYRTCISEGTDPTDPCADCEPTNWENALFAGYQVRTNAECQFVLDEDSGLYKKECVRTEEYRCAAGYYGTATGTTLFPSGCNKCPTFNGGNGNTITGQSAVGATEITDCFVEYDGETEFYDETGNYIFVSPCYYSYQSGDCQVKELAPSASCKSDYSTYILGQNCGTTKYIHYEKTGMCFSHCATCPSGYEILTRTTAYQGCNITFQTCGKI